MGRLGQREAGSQSINLMVYENNQGGDDPCKDEQMDISAGHCRPKRVSKTERYVSAGADDCQSETEIF